MIKVRYETDGSLRLGSRKTFRISSGNIENMRVRLGLDADLKPGEVFGEIYEPPPMPGPPGPSEPPEPPESRVSVNTKQ